MLVDRLFDGLRVPVRTAAGIALIASILMAGSASASGKRVLHIDSYHKGNEWNDRIAAALTEVLQARGHEVQVLYLDAKRRSGEDQKQAAALAIKRAIEETKPDVVTLSDDDAAKYLLMPYFRDSPIPFVFCGLNWDASTYGLPYANTTGMVEVSPIPQIISLLRRHARGPRIGFLAEDTETKRKEVLFHKKLFGISYDQVYFVRSFAEWEVAFLKAQREVDMLLILGVGAIPDWDAAAAARLADTASVVPSGTDFEWLMPISAFGVAKSPEEQGRWAAQAAIKILDGTPPERIPVTYNREGELFFNARIGRRLEIQSPPLLAKVLP